MSKSKTLPDGLFKVEPCRHRRCRRQSAYGAVLLIFLVVYWISEQRYTESLFKDKDKTVGKRQEHARPHDSVIDAAVPETMTIATYSIPSMPDVNISSHLRQVLHTNSTSESDGDSLSFTFQSCPPTSQLRIILQKETHNNNNNNSTSKSQWKWILQSLDEQGQPKTVGGDEFYISYLDYAEANTKIPTHQQNVYQPLTPNSQSSAVAIATDQHDGAYGLDFVRPPMEKQQGYTQHLQGRGILSIYLEYTCHMGRMVKPTKDAWRSGGLLFRTYSQPNFTIPLETIRPYRPPAHALPNLNQFDKVICFGDSLIHNSCGVGHGKLLYKVPANLHTVGDNYGKQLATNGTNDVLTIMEEAHGTDLRNPSLRTAVITGSSAWDAFSNLYPDPGWDFQDTLTRNAQFLQQMQQQRGWTNTAIFWRGPSAVHMGVLDEAKCKMSSPKRSRNNQACVERVRYMSNSIARYLNEAQRTVVALANNHNNTNNNRVYYVDVWEHAYLSGKWHMFGDAQHSRKWLNIAFLKELYPGTAGIG